MEFVRAYDKLNVLIKLIITFFLDPLIGALYRVMKGRVLTGLIWFFTGGLFGIGWLIDFITVLFYNKYTLFV